MKFILILLLIFFAFGFLLKTIRFFLGFFILKKFNEFNTNNPNLYSKEKDISENVKIVEVGRFNPESEQQNNDRDSLSN
jgi:hypothetical protein